MNRTLAEVLVELFVIINSVVLSQNTDGLQLTVQRPLGSSCLRDVCAVQIVHAICSDDSKLPVDGLWVARIHPEIPSRSAHVNDDRNAREGLQTRPVSNRQRRCLGASLCGPIAYACTRYGNRNIGT